MRFGLGFGCPNCFGGVYDGLGWFGVACFAGGFLGLVRFGFCGCYGAACGVWCCNCLSGLCGLPYLSVFRLWFGLFCGFALRLVWFTGVGCRFGLVLYYAVGWIFIVCWSACLVMISVCWFACLV